MAPLQAAILCFAFLWFLPALRLHKKSEVSVLVYGDSWGEYGPSHTMLQDMFARHGVPANVKNVGIGGTRACQWAEDQNSLLNKAKEQFPSLSSGPDFVWYTLGGNDLLDREYLKCQKDAGDEKTAMDCLEVETRKIVGCNTILLKNLWREFETTRVVQCGYDMTCKEKQCNPTYRFPYCGMNVSCAGHQFSLWQSMLMDKLNKDFAMYTGINILGTLQLLDGMANVTIGHPSIGKGSPCKMLFGCSHPIPGTPASDAIGEQFWKLFFSAYINTTGTPYKSPAKERTMLQVPQNNMCGDIEVRRTKCMWNWTPTNPDRNLSSRCNRRVARMMNISTKL